MPAPDSQSDVVAQLRALPEIAPSPALDAQVRQAAQRALLEAESPAAPTGFTHFLFYRALLPTAVSAAIVIYLGWAVQAASNLLS